MKEIFNAKDVIDTANRQYIKGILVGMFIGVMLMCLVILLVN